MAYVEHLSHHVHMVKAFIEHLSHFVNIEKASNTLSHPVNAGKACIEHSSHPVKKEKAYLSAIAICIKIRNKLSTLAIM